MKRSTECIYNELLSRYSALDFCKKDIKNAFELICNAYGDGKKLLVCGNGGSAADSEHIAGELLKSFKKKRAIKSDIYANLGKFGEKGERLKDVLEGSLRVVSLTSHIAFSSAFANDNQPYACFAQQLYGQADEGDALLLISTSGNSKNCVYCAVLAKAMNVKTVALTGKNESELSDICDVYIRVPETQTFRIQELHLPVYHCICAMLEEELF